MMWRRPGSNWLCETNSTPISTSDPARVFMCIGGPDQRLCAPSDLWAPRINSTCPSRAFNRLYNRRIVILRLVDPRRYRIRINSAGNGCVRSPGYRASAHLAPAPGSAAVVISVTSRNVGNRLVLGVDRLAAACRITPVRDQAQAGRSRRLRQRDGCAG